MQAEYVEGVERNDQETQAMIERERVTSAAVKQLKAEIKEEKSKHEEQVRPTPFEIVHCRKKPFMPQHIFSSYMPLSTLLFSLQITLAPGLHCLRNPDPSEVRSEDDSNRLLTLAQRAQLLLRTLEGNISPTELADIACKTLTGQA